MGEVAIQTVLFDLDGVVRLFDPEHPRAVERAHGLEQGVLERVAFAPELIEPAVTGVTTRAQWVRQVGDGCGSRAAAEEWLAERGRVDREVLALVDQLRASGLTAAVLTNGTDTIPAELRRLGVTKHFDAIFSTAEIGFAKPDPRAFQHVCTAMGVEPSTVFFTDDSAHKLPGAEGLGMTTHLYTGLADLRNRLGELGLAPMPT